MEAYAGGMLTEAERREVERNLLAYPELKVELAAIEETQEVLLQRSAVSPRNVVREKLNATLDARSERTVPLAASGTTFWRYAVAASVTLALITSYLAYDYRQRWISTVVSFNDLMARNQQIAEDYNQVNSRINQIESDIRVLNDPAFKRVVLAGTQNAPEAKAFVYWNEKTTEVYLSLQNIKALSQENQYQLWAIVDGKPVDAGVFDGNLAGLLKMKSIAAGASAFAVTVEPRGGKPSPTLETMQVIGTVVKV